MTAKMPSPKDRDAPRAFAVPISGEAKKKPKKASKRESNPLDKAMDILDGYYKGVPPMELKGCGCCCKKDEEDECSR